MVAYWITSVTTPLPDWWSKGLGLHMLATRKPRDHSHTWQQRIVSFSGFVIDKYFVV
ncbi:hypothetical protein ABVT39_027036 [Epinephelus coioides]